MENVIEKKIVLEKEELQERLRMHRMKSGATMAQLAEVIGVERVQTYYKKEVGMLRFALAEAVRLADFYHMTVEELFCA